MTIDPATRAAVDIATAHGLPPDRCDVLQDGNTLVLRLSETLVARVVQDRDGPRQGIDWFAREIAVAAHLAEWGAPVIPVHPDLPPGPYEHAGYPVNFWRYVTRIESEPSAEDVGRTLFQCHEMLRSFPGVLPELAILTESLDLLDTLEEQKRFPEETVALLRERLVSSMAALGEFPMQALHGDAHWGNLMHTTDGLLWTDWEDTFLGPVEWDLASIIWNARILDGDDETADGILNAYREAGGSIHPDALHHSLIARAAVMTAWYPVLYPDLSEDRKQKLQRRLEWLRNNG